MCWWSPAPDASVFQNRRWRSLIMVRYKRHLEMGTNKKEANPFSKAACRLASSTRPAPWLRGWSALGSLPHLDLQDIGGGRLAMKLSSGHRRRRRSWYDTQLQTIYIIVQLQNYISCNFKTISTMKSAAVIAATLATAAAFAPAQVGQSSTQLNACKSPQH